MENIYYRSWITILYSLGITKTVNPKMEYKPKCLSMGETVTVTRMSKATSKLTLFHSRDSSFSHELAESQSGTTWRNVIQDIAACDSPE
jgi:hypothetical protein